MQSGSVDAPPILDIITIMPATAVPLLTFADSPRNNPNLIFWYRGDAVTLVGSGVSVAKDLSQNGHDAVQATPANQPQFSQSSGPNGTPAWTFAGAQQLSAPAFNIGGLTLDVFVVCKPNNTTTFGVLVESSASPATNVGAFSETFPNTTLAFRGLHHGTGTNSSWESSPVVLNTPHIVEFTHDKNLATQQIHVLVDGVLTAQTSILNDNVTDPFGNFILNIGARGAIVTTYVGVIAEIFAYSSLLPATQKSNLLRGYLGPRYGIAVP